MIQHDPIVLPDGIERVRTYSDEGKYIRKSGTLDIYEEAVDIAPAPLYEETDIDIEPPEEEEEQPEGEEPEGEKEGDEE